MTSFRPPFYLILHFLRSYRWWWICMKHYCRNGARSVANRNSVGAEKRWTERSAKQEVGEQQRSGERGAGAKRVFRCSIQYRVYGVVFSYGTWGHFGCVSYLLRCIIRVLAISMLDNAWCALSRLIIALLQACEGPFTEKACTLHGLKGGGRSIVL